MASKQQKLENFFPKKNSSKKKPKECKIYNCKEILNKFGVIKNYIKNLCKNYKNITIKGEIAVESKNKKFFIFVIKDEIGDFKLYAIYWRSPKNKINVNNFENKTCLIEGNMEYNLYKLYQFNVTNIQLINDKSKRNKLKKICAKKWLF